MFVSFATNYIVAVSDIRGIIPKYSAKTVRLIKAHLSVLALPCSDLTKLAIVIF